MRSLTAHQRALVVERVSLAIGFDWLPPSHQAQARREARLAVEILERSAVAGASEKRACEALLKDGAK